MIDPSLALSLIDIAVVVRTKMSARARTIIQLGLQAHGGCVAMIASSWLADYCVGVG
jgi:hypothetical protein